MSWLTTLLESIAIKAVLDWIGTTIRDVVDRFFRIWTKDQEIAQETKQEADNVQNAKTDEDESKATGDILGGL